MFSKILKKAASVAKGIVSSAVTKVTLAVGAVMVGASAFAEGEAVTLPSTGVDIAGYATALITGLGAIVAICVGGTFAFMLISWGVKKVRNIGKA